MKYMTSKYSYTDMRGLLDALFYGSYKPIHIDQIKKLLNLTSRKEARVILKEYITEFNKFHKGVKLVSRKDYYYLMIKDDYIDKIRRYLPQPTLSPRQMEILALIFMKKRIPASELRDYFGPRVYSDLKKLARLHLIQREYINNKLYVTLREEAKLLIFTRRKTY